MFSLKDKVAVVTGSSRGIGRASAEQMARLGAKVVVSSRKADACEPVAAGIRAEGGEAVVIPCHVGHKEQLQALVDGTLATFGKIDILVCNAGVSTYAGPMHQATDADFTKMMNTNVMSTFWLCNMVAPHMPRGGSIILISSIAGIVGQRDIGIYGITKAADAALGRNLAIEWGPRGVRANTIAPGLIKTDMARVLWENPSKLRSMERASPLGRIGEPDDIAGAVCFLASDASAFMTGQTLVVDGGATGADPFTFSE
jgi:dehydrogenase/reductase SDR family protein 4